MTSCGTQATDTVSPDLAVLRKSCDFESLASKNLHLRFNPQNFDQIFYVLRIMVNLFCDLRLRTTIFDILRLRFTFTMRFWEFRIYDLRTGKKIYDAQH